jgi:hypothetical protein
MLHKEKFVHITKVTPRPGAQLAIWKVALFSGRFDGHLLFSRFLLLLMQSVVIVISLEDTLNPMECHFLSFNAKFLYCIFLLLYVNIMYFLENCMDTNVEFVWPTCNIHSFLSYILSCFITKNIENSSGKYRQFLNILETGICKSTVFLENL